jgi:3,4-dihydroxy 2-butanone 4-phosphate synthase / GTP cyclohydrolase II
MPFVVMDPDPLRRAELAIEDIRAGRMVILVDDEDRENEGDLTMAADAITPEAINFMAKWGRGLICLSMTEERVDQLRLPLMAAQNGTPFHTAFTVSIEAREGVTTGISAADRAHTIKVAADPSKTVADLVTPGHVFPLRARNGGVLVRTGQTEGSVDLARMAGLTPAGVICEIMNDDGTMARLPDLLRFGVEHKIRVVTVEDIIRWRVRNEVLVRRELEATLPVAGLGTFQAAVYRSETDGAVHLAVWLGDVAGDSPVLTRVQTADPVADAFGSQSCDCAAQLRGALERIHAEGRGILLYMHLGGARNTSILLERLRRHLGLPSSGLDTPAMDGLREMGSGAQMLVDLGVRQLRLMTNNPRKIVGLEGYGLVVSERVPLAIPVSEDNASFLRTQRLELGHLIPNLPL